LATSGLPEMPPLRVLAFACLTVMTMALRPSPATALRTSRGRCQRSIAVFAKSKDLPAGWTSGVDQQSGQTYYYNEVTGESRWETPPQDHGGAQTLPAGWTSGMDEASGATYYFNEKTGQSQWEPPAKQQGAPAASDVGSTSGGSGSLREKALRVLTTLDASFWAVLVLVVGLGATSILGREADEAAEVKVEEAYKRDIKEAKKVSKEVDTMDLEIEELNREVDAMLKGP